MEANLKGRVAVVTGGNSGIGFAIAEGLAQAGARVVIASRREAKTRQALAQLARSGLTVSAITVDVASKASVDRLIRRVAKDFGRMDVLVACAGVNRRKAPQDFSVSEWQEILDVNLRGPFLCAQAAYPLMKASGGGRIINIGSMTSTFGAPHMAPYAASKGGLAQLTKSLAAAWAPDRILVNAILPGWIYTDLTAQACKNRPGLYKKVAKSTPLGRWGMPKDVAGLAVFLAGGGSDFITGALIPLDGGCSAVGSYAATSVPDRGRRAAGD